MGANSVVQLGDNSTQSKNYPVLVNGLLDVEKIGAGGEDAFAIKKDGTVWVWGANNWGQLADGTQSNRIVPFQLQALTGGAEIVMRDSNTIVLRADGTMLSTGNNYYGQLGDGTPTTYGYGYQSFRATFSGPVSNITNAVTISGGNSTFHAILKDGVVMGWGNNGNGQLGDETATLKTKPVMLARLMQVTMKPIDATPGSITMNYGVNGTGNEYVDMYCLKRASSIIYEGKNQSYTDVGLTPGSVYSYKVEAFDTKKMQLGASQTVLAKSQSKFASGEKHAVLLKEDGTVWTWGRNDRGQLGDKTNSDVTFPRQTAGLKNILEIAAGEKFAIDIQTDGSVWAWGKNDKGQLGDGTIEKKLIPTQVKGMVGIKDVAAGFTHSSAVKEDGTVFAFGHNWNGQLGDSSNENRLLPVPVLGLNNVSTVYGGMSSSYILKTGGTVWGWGLNKNGQLGNNSTLDQPMPIQALTIMELYGQIMPNVTSVTLTFAGNGNATKYVVKRSDNIIYEGTNITYLDTNLTSGTPYVYDITAYDDKGNLLGRKTLTITTK